MFKLWWGRFAAVLAGLFVCVSSESRSLSGRSWTVVNSNGTIKTNATVPGGIYSDLIDGGIIADYIFHGKNDLKYRWVGKEDWTYTTHFTLTKSDFARQIRLVFHGLDTIADIWLNDQHVGNSTNMFVRTVMDIQQLAKEGTNKLDVKFQSPVKAGSQLASTIGYDVPPLCPNEVYHGECNVNQLRKMQASFSWDWGPAFPSVGIWKDVELELSDANPMRDVGVRTLDIETEVENYRVEVTVWFDRPLANGYLTIVILLENGHKAKFNSSISVKRGEFKTELSLPKRQTKLWWPRGYGKSTLYTMSVEFVSNADIQRKNLQIGIRTVEMVQHPIIYRREKGGLTFYLKVNKIPVFVKGSNWIPLDVLPERGSEPGRLFYLLNSALEANFNSLRVWGGGVYESDLFYKYCDRNGILIWQDLMFACAMYPSTSQFLDSVREEIVQQIKRLQHHPSIFSFGGNNENEAALVQNWYGTTRNASLYRHDYLALYVKTIKPIVESLDESRQFFTSSPSNGNETALEGYISKNPQDSLFGDVHFYIYLANMWDSTIYPVPRFTSEYGMQSFPSIHTLAKVLPPEDLQWESDGLRWRQHSPSGSLYIKFQTNLNLPPSDKLEDIIYFSQINQAMAMKTETEHYRRYKTLINDANEGRTMGALYWQLNDVWEAPTWSSIDYLGNWKMLHYYARNFLHDLLVVPIQTAYDLEVYVVSDANILTSPHPINVVVKTSFYDWNHFEPISSRNTTATMLPGDSQLIFAAPLSSTFNRSTTDFFLTFALDGAPDNFLFPGVLKNSNYPNATVKITKTEIIQPNVAVIELESNAIALFVWLESPLQSWRSRFSDNGFHMFSPMRRITVTVEGGVTEEFVKSITVRNLKKSYIVFPSEFFVKTCMHQDLPSLCRKVAGEGKVVEVEETAKPVTCKTLAELKTAPNVKVRQTVVLSWSSFTSEKRPPGLTREIMVALLEDNTDAERFYRAADSVTPVICLSQDMMYIHVMAPKAAEMNQANHELLKTSEIPICPYVALPSSVTSVESKLVRIQRTNV